ncbi:MAG: hypothetical protein A2Z35_04775 [Actinobacteria bacterium RBG_19FT_COMBO_36_27]|nr:MAG: hypothetical protein A2Z35_04775 [Actinobacteria bacterium RBG_19FT_COMBO_36_27]
MKGYMGKVLFVNLTDKTSQEIPVDEQTYREYIGGYGLGAKFIYERIKPGSDPLGPGNVLGFLAGPFVGTRYHGSGRLSVVCKSPLTGGWADSSCGGFFARNLKKAGYDGIFFEGASKDPVCVYINDDKVEFMDASDLWGKDSIESEDIVKEKLGKGAEIVTIGQAGESLSRIAAIMHDRGRAAARLGVGAVMGSKKLKAVAVSGTHSVSIANEKAYEELLERMKADFKSSKGLNEVIGKLGSACAFENFALTQDAPIQNWRSVSTEVYPQEKIHKLAAENFLDFKVKKYACAQCLVGCGAILKFKDSKGKTWLTHRPEYETVGAFASNTLIDDLETIIMANEMCNRYGFDTISAGGTLGFAMECYEKGLITDKDTGGLSLEWGNKDAVLPFLEMMAKREGIGAIFADGVKVASEKIGPESEEFAIHMGGSEPSCHDPRRWPGFGYGYVLDPKLGHHTVGGIGFLEHGFTEKELDQSQFEHLTREKYNYENKGKPLFLLNTWYQFFYSLGMCMYTYYGYTHFPVIEALKAETGWDDFTLDEAMKAGERIYTLRQCFALREGVDMKNITLPKRLMGIPPLKTGLTAGVTLDMETVKKDYYKAFDWDPETAKPSKKKLEYLNLSKLCDF